MTMMMAVVIMTSSTHGRLLSSPCRQPQRLCLPMVLWFVGVDVDSSTAGVGDSLQRGSQSVATTSRSLQVCDRVCVCACVCVCVCLFCEGFARFNSLQVMLCVCVHVRMMCARPYAACISV